MKKTKTLLWSALALVLLSLPAMAQMTQPAGGNARPNHPDEILHNPRALARFLKLTPAQQETLKTLNQELQAKVKPIREEQKALREQLADQLEAASPNACTIGDTALDIHENHEEIEAAVAEFDTKFTAILTPEQKRRYEALKEAAKLLRGDDE